MNLKELFHPWCNFQPYVMNAVNIFSLGNIRIKHADIIHLLKCHFIRKTIAFPSHLHSITRSISNLWKLRKDSLAHCQASSHCPTLYLGRTPTFTIQYLFFHSQRLLINFDKENKKIWALRVKQEGINVKMFQSTSVLNNGIPFIQILTCSWSPTWTWYNRGNVFPWKKKALHKMCKKFAANY